MKRILSILALLAAPSTSTAAPAAIACDAGVDHVVYDGATATYFSAGTRVGASKCGGTRMAIYNTTCTESPAFAFYFASVPGPAVLGGKSARLDAAGKNELLTCK